MVDEDGFEIEDCDCDYGDMARRMGVSSMAKTTAHYASALITSLTRGNITTAEEEEEWKHELGELMVNIVALLHGLSHYVGPARMDQLMEERNATIAEAREAFEKIVAASAN